MVPATFTHNDVGWVCTLILLKAKGHQPGYSKAKPEDQISEYALIWRRAWGVYSVKYASQSKKKWELVPQKDLELLQNKYDVVATMYEDSKWLPMIIRQTQLDLDPHGLRP